MPMNASNSQEIQEFLHMDPDTGMLVTMVADGDGFRAATAADEFQSTAFAQLVAQARESNDLQQTQGFDLLERGHQAVSDFLEHCMNAYERSFPPSDVPVREEAGFAAPAP